LAVFASNISPVIIKENKVNQKIKKVEESIPSFIKATDEEQYKELLKKYNTNLSMITAKYIAELKTETNPSKTTLQIVSSLLLLLRELDESIVLNVNKNEAPVIY